MVRRQETYPTQYWLDPAIACFRFEVQQRLHQCVSQKRQQLQDGLYVVVTESDNKQNFTAIITEVVLLECRSAGLQGFSVKT